MPRRASTRPCGTRSPATRRPPAKPLTIAAYEAGAAVTAYVRSVAAGDSLPDVPLYLAPGCCVRVHLDAIYAAAFARSPSPIRDQLEGRGDAP